MSKEKLITYAKKDNQALYFTKSGSIKTSAKGNKYAVAFGGIKTKTTDGEVKFNNFKIVAFPELIDIDGKIVADCNLIELVGAIQPKQTASVWGELITENYKNKHGKDTMIQVILVHHIELHGINENIHEVRTKQPLDLSKYEIQVI